MLFAPDTRFYCRRCGVAVLYEESRTGGRLCRACYQYAQQHGSPRPWTLIMGVTGYCADCGWHLWRGDGHQGGRCRACLAAARQAARLVPIGVCGECQVPLYHGDRHRGGQCSRCYMRAYMRQRAQARKAN